MGYDFIDSRIALMAAVMDSLNDLCFSSSLAISRSAFDSASGIPLGIPDSPSTKGMRILVSPCCLMRSMKPFDSSLFRILKNVSRRILQMSEISCAVANVLPWLQIWQRTRNSLGFRSDSSSHSGIDGRVFMAQIGLNGAKGMSSSSLNPPELLTCCPPLASLAGGGPWLSPFGFSSRSRFSAVT